MAFIESEWSTPVNFTVRAEDPIDTQMMKLLPDGRDLSGNFFGKSVAMSGDTLTAAIGADHERIGDIASGGVHIYTRSGDAWNIQAIISANDGVSGDFFGYAVSLSNDGNTLIVGAYGDDDLANYAGAAYVFTRSGVTWTQQAKLLASDAAEADYFGYSVSLSSDGNTALIGAYGDDIVSYSSQGAAYVFVRSGSVWTQQAKLLPSSSRSYLQLGFSVSLSNDGNYAIVGGSPISVAEYVYIFLRTGTTWTQQAALQASDGATNDKFGASVAMSGDSLTAIIGANGDDSPLSNAGSAYVFTRSGAVWTQQAKLVAGDGAANDAFGYAVSLSSNGNMALIGARMDDSPLSNAGSAYTFTRSGAIWTQRTKLVAAVPVADEKLGSSVCMSSDGIYALAGAPDCSTNGVESGAFYAFKTTSAWVSTSIGTKYLSSISNSVGNTFGYSVALSEDGTTAVISAHGDEGYKGAAYVFIRSGFSWTQQAKLVASDGVASDTFGSAVAISDDGNMALIGAYGVVGSKGAAYVFTRSGVTWTQQAKLVASDGVASDQFGSSIAINNDGTTALIGAQGDDVSFTNQGSSYVFTRSGSVWTQQAKLIAGDASANDVFGVSVAISDDGNTALTGAYGDDTNRGSAYIFTRSGVTWTQQGKLVASDGVSGDLFGQSVSLSSNGDIALIGARGDDTSRGSAYIFTRSGVTWTQQAKLVAGDAAAGDLFGFSVQLSSAGTRAAIGAYSANVDKGAVYTFVGSGSSWFQQSKLIASDGQANDYFGQSVCISGDGSYILAGAYGDDDKGTDSGSAYGFSTGFFAEKAKLLASDGVTGDQFGYAVAISSDGLTALVSAPGNNGKGAAYVFTRSGVTWTQQAKLIASDGMSADSFGRVSLSSDGNTALIGTPMNDVSTKNNQGCAYVFTRSGVTWTQQAKLLASDGAANDQFGYSVTLSDDGNTACIGSNYNNYSTINLVGSAYIFTRSESTWTQQAILNPSDIVAGKYFGESVSLSSDGNTVIIGAVRDSQITYNQGAAYVFTRSGVTWTQQAKLFASDGHTGSNFGCSVALSGDGNTAVVGVYNDNAGGNSAGAAYVFTRSGGVWTQEVRLLVSDSIVSSFFGWSVSISKNSGSVVVGAFHKSNLATNRGCIYLFTRAGGVFTQKNIYTSSDGASQDLFGSGVALNSDGTVLLVGAFGDDSERGSAYVFQP